jgi:hypothetical protein
MISKVSTLPTRAGGFRLNPPRSLPPLLQESTLVTNEKGGSVQIPPNSLIPRKWQAAPRQTRKPRQLLLAREIEMSSNVATGMEGKHHRSMAIRIFGRGHVFAANCNSQKLHLPCHGSAPSAISATAAAACECRLDQGKIHAPGVCVSECVCAPYGTSTRDEIRINLPAARTALASAPGINSILPACLPSSPPTTASPHNLRLAEHKSRLHTHTLLQAHSPLTSYTSRTALWKLGLLSNYTIPRSPEP